MAVALVLLGTENRTARNPEDLSPEKRDGALRCRRGGGSLVYGNTLYEPFPSFFTDARWGHITDWRAELTPFYDQAKRMLGVVANPTMTAADDVMRAVAEEMGGRRRHLVPRRWACTSVNPALKSPTPISAVLVRLGRVAPSVVSA